MLFKRKSMEQLRHERDYEAARMRIRNRQIAERQSRQNIKNETKQYRQTGRTGPTAWGVMKKSAIMGYNFLEKATRPLPKQEVKREKTRKRRSRRSRQSARIIYLR